MALRPKSVHERSLLGNWESDLVEGSKDDFVLVALAKRKDRLTLADKTQNQWLFWPPRSLLGTWAERKHK